MNPTVAPTRVDPETFDDQISLLELASLVLRRRRLILLSTFAGVALALVLAFTSPIEYTATASFMSQEEEQAGLAGFSGLAQQFGFAMPRTGGSQRSPEFYQDLLRTREIVASVVESGVEVVTAAGVTTVDLAERFEIGSEVSDEVIARTRRYVVDIISVSVSRETGVVTVGVRTDEAELSVAILRRLLYLVSEFDMETRRSAASAERAFSEERLGQLQGELSTAEDLLKSFLDENRQFSNSAQLTFDHDRLARRVAMRQEFASAMAQAYEQARSEEVRNTPAITLIDHPEVPALPDARGRLLKLVLGLVLGLMAGLVFAFAREFGKREKAEESRAYGEFQEVLSEAKRDLFGLRRSSRTARGSEDSNS